MALSRNFVLVTEGGDTVHVDADPDRDLILVRRAGSRSPAFSLTRGDAAELVHALGDLL